jgi:hypothetical protein
MVASNSMNRGIKLLIRLGFVSLIFLASFFIPYKSTTAPKWRIQVVDDTGRPIRGLRVSEEWMYFDVDNAPWVDIRHTDDEGNATFPRRTIWLPLALRPSFGRTTGSVHTGPSVFILACDERHLQEAKLFWDGDAVSYKEPPQIESRVVAKPVQYCTMQ